jgi:hypothetical protein
MSSPPDQNGSPAPAPDRSEPVLRTLSPLLRNLAQSVRTWLDTKHRYPLPTIARATLEGLVTDLNRQAEALDQDRPMLVVMLMGGTGVGKSTLLNALAGGDIAQASFARPTTKDPVVYFHESVKPESLDPVLQKCRLAMHNRGDLREKVLVDTPDLDSNDLENREILYRVLPVADIVLYVGSQEKYHDKLGWDLFLQQRRRRAFAFVMNKWDRCQNVGVGLRPDEDWLHDLKEEGFQDPLLFRVCAQHWVDVAKHREGDGQTPSHGLPPVEAHGLPPVGVASPAESSTPTEAAPTSTEAAPDPKVLITAPETLPARPYLPEQLPAGEQFEQLVAWLNSGLNRLEIEAIKARGISQLLRQLLTTLEAACPPDLRDVSERTRSSWERLLVEEAKATANVLLNTLDPYQREIEHYFAVETQRRFRGLMAGYLNLFTKAKYASKNLGERIPFLPRPLQKVETPASWDLQTFTRTCSSVAGERHLDARGRALANRLLLEADQQGYPLELLNQPTEAASHLDWRQRYAQALIEILHHVEQQWSNPTGTRKAVQSAVIFMADWVPTVALLGTCIMLLWQYTMSNRSFDRGDLVLPFIILLISLIIMHFIIAFVLPMRWPAMRGEFHRQLEKRLMADLQNTYSSIPQEVAGILRDERRQAEKLAAETREVADWLHAREQAASITSLYGH